MLSPPPVYPAPTLPQVRKSNAVIYGVVAITIAGVAVGIWAANRTPPSPPAIHAQAAPPPDPTPTPVPVPPPAPAPDIWNNAPSAPPPSVEHRGFRPGQLAGTAVAIGDAKLILPPGFTHQWSQGTVVATSKTIPVIIAAAPLVGDSNDGPTLAREYATQTGLTLDGATSVTIAGTLRPVAALHGSVNGVAVSQAAIAYIGKGYRFGILFTVAYDRRNDATLLKFGDDFLAHRVILP